MMANPQLFGAFLLITLVLILTPGPIVTLVIATSAEKGVRAGLATVAGTTLGNAILLAAIALGLGWVLAHALPLFEALRWIGAARPGAAQPAGQVLGARVARPGEGVDRLALPDRELGQ